ncbi:LAME_0G02630g1_1 [Lachancea meyersii CBS 8951]|uniref:Peptidyl-prolyl cis-trans isomerase n=1 Tax=Lachancea meyersii CBS 8951 TaxID=1266667 RepID=A0A1G4K669_9SACH|nr:LAME_0G02630g1_1 [Lachancea meyersii CBS 8951]
MSVLFETTLGDVVIDVDCKAYSVEAFNFIKQCKSGFFKYQCFYNLNKDYSIECGDALVGNELRNTLRIHNASIHGLLSVEKPMSGEVVKSSQEYQKFRQAKLGDVAYLTSLLEDNVPVVGSKFMISLADHLSSYDDIVVFGSASTESLAVLRAWNAQTVDDAKRPKVDIRIKEVHVLHDPYPDPNGFQKFDVSLPRGDVRLPPNMLSQAAKEQSEQQRAREIRSKELTLEILGDIPHVGIKPSERVLFVCKLNRMTRAKDLAVIFHRFGLIDTIEIVHDKETGSSLGYGFIEFANKKSCETAYAKMDGVLIDDRRIHVDFCQSAKKLNYS